MQASSLKKRNAFRGRIHRGFTLIELLLVMVIIAILATVVAVNIHGKPEQAKKTAAIAQIGEIRTALNEFEIANGRLPTSSEGLAALVNNPDPGNLTAWTKYLDKMPNDPWGRPYKYQTKEDESGGFELYSTGPSGQDQQGTGDNISGN